MLIKSLRFITALALLFLLLYLGKWLNLLIPIGIPESIWGMLLLFSLLVTKLVKVSWVYPATRPLLRYMTIFFLPICAGIIEQVDVLSAHLEALLLANFLSTVICLVVIGYLAQWLFEKETEKDSQGEKRDD
ncbi:MULTISPECIES: CidA/LrgA family protein [Glaesserella]|uniref:Murein hydrolase transporter LrgA n=1 Tax=Glaesserella australis TaxID=2094024 RepID=A0A328BVX6_9PAST|nr:MULTISPECIES: CidA/LrgA family protein [Glaesserella]AUI65947.1 murein hydrolase transporter LrgA [Glaesserella sp. 15-184]RAL18333.1 murein hydrolase transporter LrgA [Glaesserella australis]